MGNVKKNVAFTMAYQLLAIALPLVTSPYLSRVLGAEGIGLYSYSFSVAGYFVIFAMLGIANHGNREIASAEANGGSVSTCFWSVFSVQFVSGSVCTVVYAFYGLYCWNEESSLIALIWLPYLISSILDISWLFFGLEEFKITVVRNTVVKLLSFCSILIFVKDPSDVSVYVAIMSSSFLLNQIILWPFAVKRIGRPTIDSILKARRHIKPILVLFVPVVAVSLYTVLTKLMLGVFSDYSQVGFYSNADYIVGVPLSLIAAVGTAFLPRMVKVLTAEGSSEDTEGYLYSGVFLTGLVSSVFVFGIISVSTTFSIVFWGESFSSCGNLMAILALMLPFAAWASVLRTQYLIPMQRDKSYVASVLCGGATNVLLGLILIPKYAAMGAAISVTLSQVVVCLVQTLSVRRDLPLLKMLKPLLPIYAISFAFGLLGRALFAGFEPGFLSLMVELAICLLFMVVAAALLYRTSNEVRILAKAFKAI